MKNQAQDQLITHVVMPAARILAEMEYYGVSVDMVTINELDRIYTKAIQEAEM